MMWRFVGALGAIAILAIDAASPAAAACTNLQCRCAVAVGGTYNPQTNRWRVGEVNMNSWEYCLSHGGPISSAPSTPAPANPRSKKPK